MESDADSTTKMEEPNNDKIVKDKKPVDNYLYPDDASSSEEDNEESQDTSSNNETITDAPESEETLKHETVECDEETPSSTPASSVFDFVMDFVYPIGRRKSLQSSSNSSSRHESGPNNDFKLRDAINNCNIEEVQKIVDSSFTKISMNMVMSSIEKSVEITKIMINSGKVDVNELFESTLYHSKMTALEYLSMNSASELWPHELEIAALLIKKGAYVNAITEKESRPIYLAIKNNNIELVKLFLENKATFKPHPKVNDTAMSALYNAVTGIHCLEMVKLLFPHLSLRMTCPVMNSNTLHWLIENQVASRKEVLDLASLFLIYGVSMEQQNSKGNTPLLEAISYGQLDLVTFFLERGSDVNQMSFVNGIFPLYVAANLTEPEEAIDILMRNGANIHKTTTDGQTVLHQAAALSNARAIKCLLKHGANVSATVPNTKQTPYITLLGTSKHDEAYQESREILVDEIIRMHDAGEKVDPSDWEIVSKYQKVRENRAKRQQGRSKGIWMYFFSWQFFLFAGCMYALTNAMVRYFSIPEHIERVAKIIVYFTALLVFLTFRIFEHYGDPARKRELAKEKARKKGTRVAQ